MADQAQRLRELIEEKSSPVISLAAAREETSRKTRTIAVTSGKGGVGKTNLVANLAIALARRGKKVLVVDADLSLANVDVLLGLQPQFNLSHVIWGQKELADIVVEGPAGVRVIPASSGVRELAMLRDFELEGIVEKFAELEAETDLVLIDTAAGISDSVLSFVFASDEVFLVTTPEPTAYVDAYQMLKTVHHNDPSKPVSLIVNMAQTESEIEKTAHFMGKMAQQFLRHDLKSLGGLLRDPEVPGSIRKQKSFLEQYPHSPASLGIQRLATRVLNAEFPEESGEGGTLWKRVVGFLKKPDRN